MAQSFPVITSAKVIHLCSENLCSWLEGLPASSELPIQNPDIPKNWWSGRSAFLCPGKSVCKPGQSSQFRGSWPQRSRYVQRGASLDLPHPSGPLQTTAIAKGETIYTYWRLIFSSSLKEFFFLWSSCTCTGWPAWIAPVMSKAQESRSSLEQHSRK